jgi:HEAT repeat protein
MKFFPRVLLLVLALVIAHAGFAQVDEQTDEAEQLKIAALEALMHGPSDRALPIVAKALSGNHSDEVKSRALFVLSQMEYSEARELLVQTANTSSGELRLQAIRMIGINGDPEALVELRSIYQSADMDTKQAVLHAYLIADDRASVLEIAASATDDEEFRMAVNMLGTMGAIEELRSLGDRDGSAEGLVHAMSITGDSEGLRNLAMDSSNPKLQVQAVQALGIVGDSGSKDILLEIYRSTENADVRRSALRGLSIADADDAVIQLFRDSNDNTEKAELLRMLSVMGSDAALDLIDETFAEDL